MLHIGAEFFFPDSYLNNLNGHPVAGSSQEKSWRDAFMNQNAALQTAGTFFYQLPGSHVSTDFQKDCLARMYPIISIALDEETQKCEGNGGD